VTGSALRREKRDNTGLAWFPRDWQDESTTLAHTAQVMTVTGPFSSARRPEQGLPRVPTPPSGWPIGSYSTYAEAQRAVEHLAGNDFAVSDVTIVGVDLMLVERVIGRLSWGKVLGTGAVSGAWFGLFVGLLLSFFSPGVSIYQPILVGLLSGMLFGLVFAAISYASTRGRRDFSSASQLVAGRYDVLCQPRNAERGRDLLAKLAMRPS
jgi:hypothetical protein